MKSYQIYRTNFLVALTLLKRDIKIIFLNLKNNVIDAIILGLLYTILYGYFFPALGMQLSNSLPLFLGIIINLLVSVAYSKCVGMKSEIDFKRFFDYHLTLMISKYWLIAEYIIAYTIDLIISTLPAFIIGLTLLYKISKFEINLGLFFIIYFLSSLFLSLLFLFIAFGISWNWFINNTWERLLSPMTHLGGVFFVWYRLEKAWPSLANMVIFNPIIYMTEGLRYSVLGPQNFIPIKISITVLFFSSLFLIIPLIYAMNKHLDPV